MATSITAEAGGAFHQAQVYAYYALQWLTSWYYWGFGIALGTTAGIFYGLRKYWGTLLYDAYHLFGKPAPAPVRAARAAPEPAAVPATASAKAAEAARIVGGAPRMSVTTAVHVPGQGQLPVTVSKS